MKFLVAGMLWILGITQAVAESQDNTQLDIETAKRSVIELGNEISEIENRLVSPISTKASLYVALNSGRYFKPLTLKVSGPGFVPISYVYTEKDIQALYFGGVQPLPAIEMAPGYHSIRVVIHGQDERQQERDIVYEGTVRKGQTHLKMLLSIVDNAAQRSAVATLKAW